MESSKLSAMHKNVSEFIYSPEDFLGWALRSGWNPNVLPVGVIYAFQAPVTQAIAGQTDRFVENTDLTVSNARMFMTIDDGAPVLVARLNPGSASMVTRPLPMACRRYWAIPPRLRVGRFACHTVQPDWTCSQRAKPGRRSWRWRPPPSSRQVKPWASAPRRPSS